MGIIKECIKRLIQGQTLNSTEIMSCMREIMTAEATPSQIVAFLTALNFVPMTADVLFSSATIMSSLAVACPLENTMDIVGTGGDAMDTFNVSTASAFVVAAAGGRVAKHGNRSSSGRCGSADLVEALGAKLDLSKDQVMHLVNQHNFGFLFAQSFHPAMKSVGPIRRELGIRTVFNVLGPLTNPARPSHMLVGVGTLPLGSLYAEVLAKEPTVKKAMIVHSVDHGLDEISTCGKTKVWFVDGGNVQEYYIDCSHFGIEEHPIESILGSTPAENCQTFISILKGEAAHQPKLVPIEDFVTINAAAGLFVLGKVQDLKEGVEVAKRTIHSGEVLRLVETYVKETQKFQ